MLTKQKILNFLKNRGPLRTRTIALGVGRVQDYVLRCLKALEAAGSVVRVDGGRGPSGIRWSLRVGA